MPSVYTYSATNSTASEFITVVDTFGNQFRIRLDRLNGGFTINKVADCGCADAISINSILSNEIRIK